jgi:hypothetical protein
MDAITLSVEIKEDRQITIQLPPDVPLGTATLVLLPQNADVAPNLNPAREAVRAKLLAANFLRTYPSTSDIESLSDAELPLALPPGSLSLDEMIDEDRGVQ